MTRCQHVLPSVQDHMPSLKSLRFPHHWYRPHKHFHRHKAHFDTIICILLPWPFSNNNFSKQRTVKFQFRSLIGSPPDSSPLPEKNEGSILRLPLLPCDIQVLLKMMIEITMTKTKTMTITITEEMMMGMTITIPMMLEYQGFFSGHADSCDLRECAMSEET